MLNIKMEKSSIIHFSIISCACMIVSNRGSRKVVHHCKSSFGKVVPDQEHTKDCCSADKDLQNIDFCYAYALF